MQEGSTRQKHSAETVRSADVPIAVLIAALRRAETQLRVIADGAVNPGPAEAEDRVFLPQEIAAYAEGCADEIAELLAYPNTEEIAAVLRPFARLETGIEGNNRDVWFRHDGDCLRVGDFRAARDLLARLTPSPPQAHVETKPAATPECSYVGCSSPALQNNRFCELHDSLMCGARGGGSI